MAQLHQGGCLCAGSRYKVSADPQFTVKCFCGDCQKMSGGGHLPQLAFPKDTFEHSGSITVYEKKSEAGNDLKIAFCNTCGSPLFKFTSKLEDHVFVTAGSLDDPAIFKSEHMAFEACRRDWDH